MRAPAFADLPQLVLGPLVGRPDVDWHRAPPGKWSPLQIVQHLAIGIDGSARTFDSRRAHAPMRRRPRTVWQWLGYMVILRVGWYPTGFQSPAAVRPAERPDRAAVERQFREGLARFAELERELLPARARDLFVKHPRLGHLTLPEWVRFHAARCARPPTRRTIGRPSPRPCGKASRKRASGARPSRPGPLSSLVGGSSGSIRAPRRLPTTAARSTATRSSCSRPVGRPGGCRSSRSR